MKPITKKVKLSEVRFDEAIYPRKKHDPALVQRYAGNLESIEARGNFMCLSECNRLLDGKHRYLGYQTAYPEEPDREVSVYVYPVTSDDDCLDLAAQLNATSGWQLTDGDKRAVAIKMYNRANRPTQAHIAKILGVTLARVSEWLKSILQEEQAAREERALEMWMSCRGTQKEIAVAVGMDEGDLSKFLQKTWESSDGKDSQLFRDFTDPASDDDSDDKPKSSLRIYSVWSFPKATNTVKHFGNIPPEIADNLLYYYTQPFDVVFDPFGGGGSTIDRCLARKRRYYVSDLNPIVGRQEEIRKHDITTGLPEDLPVPDLVFLDPPYWKQAEEKYSKDATDLGNVDLEKFLDTIGNIARDVKRKWSSAKRTNGKLSLIIGPWKEDGKYVDLAFLCYQRIAKYLPLVQRFIVPYSTEVHGGAFVKAAKEKKETLYLHRDLMVFGIGSDQ